MTTNRERLDQIEQTISVPDTQQGGEQRLWLHVPTHASQLAMGARGANHPVGPPGIALSTTANFAVSIGQNTIFDGDGNVIFHSVGASRYLAEARLAISSNADVRVGAAQSVEITAGGAGFADPSYERGRVVPDPPDVDTAQPRAVTEGVSAGHTLVWKGWKVAAAWRSLLDVFDDSSGIGSGNVATRVASVLSAVRATWTVGSTLWNSLVAIADHFDDPHVADYGSGPKVTIHGDGGVQLTSPHKVGLFGAESVEVSSVGNATMTGSWSASVYSGGNAKVSGIASATLESKGVAGVKARVAQVAGDHVALKGKVSAHVGSKRDVLVQAEGKVAVNAAGSVGVAGADAGISGNTSAMLEAKEGAALVKAKTEARLLSDDKVLVRGRSSVQVRQGSSTYALLEGDQIELHAGQSQLIVDSGGTRVSRRHRFESGEVRLQGTVYLG